LPDFRIAPSIETGLFQDSWVNFNSLRHTSNPDHNIWAALLQTHDFASTAPIATLASAPGYGQSATTPPHLCGHQTSGIQQHQCHQWRRKRQQSRLIVQFQLFRCLFHLPTNNIGCMRITGGKLLEFQRNVANLPDLLQIEVLKMIEEIRLKR